MDKNVNTKKNPTEKKKRGKKNKENSGKSKGISKDRNGKNKLHIARKSFSANENLIWNQVKQDNTQVHPLIRKKTPPFVTGTSTNKTHNIGIKIQELKKAKVTAKGVLTNRLNAAQSVQKGRKVTIISTPPSIDTKAKDLFADLHDEYSELLRAHIILQRSAKGDAENTKLRDLENQLKRKEFQINVMVQIYEENLKFRENLMMLKKKESTKLTKNTEVVLKESNMKMPICANQ